MTQEPTQTSLTREPHRAPRQQRRTRWARLGLPAAVLVTAATIGVVGGAHPGVHADPPPDQSGQTDTSAQNLPENFAPADDAGRAQLELSHAPTVFTPPTRMAAPAADLASTDSLAAAATGSVSKPVLNLLCKFQGDTGEPRSKDQIAGLFGSTFPSMDSYFQEMSFGAINLSGTQTTNWYVMPQPLSGYNGSLDAMAQDCTNAATNDWNYNNYTIINLWFNEFVGQLTGGYTGANIQGQQWRSVTWLPADTTPAVVEHEMSHAFGVMWHSTNDAWDILSNPFEPQCISSSYGCVGQGLIATNRIGAGWLPDSRQTVYGGSGSQSVTLAPLSEPNNSNTLLARVPIAGPSQLQGVSAGSDFYSVEYRKRSGYDAGLPGDAVIIHRVTDQVSNGWHYYVPATVMTAANDGATGNTASAGAMWTAGESFHDTTNNITIRVDSINSSAASITVNPSGPVVTPTPPPTATPAPLPATPANLRVTATTAFDPRTSDVTLQWDAQPSGTRIKYDLQMRNGQSSFWQDIPSDATSRTGVARRLRNGDSYGFRVRLCTGPCSDWTPVLQLTVPTPAITPVPTKTPPATSTPPATATPPAATSTPAPTASPTPSPVSGGSVGTPSGLQSTTVTASSVGLSWTAASGSPSSYTVSYQPYNSGHWTAVSVVGSANTTTISGLNAGSWYQIKVQACQGSQCSAPTDVLAVITPVA